MPDTLVRPTAAELRTQLEEAGDKLRELRQLDPDKRGDTFASDVRAATTVIYSLDAELMAYERLERAAAGEARGPEAAFAELLGEGYRTFGERTVQDESYAEFARAGRSSSTFHEFEVRGSLHEARTLLDSAITGPSAGLWRPVGTPIPPTPREQRLFLRDVLPVMQTTLAAVPYIRELNPATNETGATSVVEGTAKPEVVMQFEQDTAVIRKIAAWIPVTTEIIDDAPLLQGYIDNRLAYMLAFREEAQLLNGDGTGASIKGIRQYSGKQTQNVVASDFPATIGLAISKIENVDGDANFVACNPLDYWVAVTTRHSNAFDNGRGGNAPAIAQGVTWGLPAIRTRGMESGKALVGDRNGATVFDRMQTTIKVGNQHSDYFTTNKVAILAEERVGLAVERPDLFVEATVPTS